MARNSKNQKKISYGRGKKEEVVESASAAGVTNDETLIKIVPIVVGELTPEKTMLYCQHLLPYF